MMMLLLPMMMKQVNLMQRVLPLSTLAPEQTS